VLGEKFQILTFGYGSHLTATRVRPSGRSPARSIDQQSRLCDGLCVGKLKLVVEEKSKLDLSTESSNIGLIENATRTLPVLAQRALLGASATVQRTPPSLVGSGRASFCLRYAGRNMPHRPYGRYNKADRQGMRVHGAARKLCRA
jgi:hypothetical protein